jgi:hypothetical protein
MDAITRPNGKVYRPRKPPVAQTLWYEDEGIHAVLVFGTHDPVVARPLAEAAVQAAVDEFYSGIAVSFTDIEAPRLVWYGTQIAGTNDDGSLRVTYGPDAERGRPAVLWDVHEEDA